MKDALKKARDVYIYDSTGMLKDHHVLFKTSCYNDQEVIFSCLVLPPTELGRHGLMFDHRNPNLKSYYATHRVHTHDGYVCDARLMIKIKESKKLIDPFDFRHNGGKISFVSQSTITWTFSQSFLYHVIFLDCNQAIWQREAGGEVEWKDVTYERYCYERRDAGGRTWRIETDEVNQVDVVHLEEKWIVDCPSWILVYLPEKDKAFYSNFKLMSNHFIHVPTQCAVHSHYVKSKKSG